MAEAISIHTLHVEAVLLLLLCTLLTVGNSMLYRGMRGIHWFSAFNFFGFLSALAVALRDRIPDIVSIVGGNLFFVAAYVLFFISLATLFGSRRIHFWIQSALLLIAALAMLEWGLFHPDTTLRLIAYSIILCLQEVHIVLFVYGKEDRALRRVGSPLALMVGALAITNLIRVAGLVLHGAPAEYLQAGPFLAYIVMVNSCLQCGIVVGYVWMTAALLRNDLQTQATTDPLTGLLNRRAFEQAAANQLAIFEETSNPLTAITVDLDHFKAINDSHGHHRGDETLIAVAKVLLEHTRRTDLLARMGGDEFAILMPGTALTEATSISDRLRTAIATLTIGAENQTGVTASLGIAPATGETPSWEFLSAQCDKALYMAKREGGNQATSGT
jgi:diguanylate cyclase (GGDEF)-like protein